MSQIPASSSQPAPRAVDRRETPPRKGRGAVSNRDGRFEVLRSEPADDGWPAWDDGLVPEALRTTVTPDRAKTVITRNTSPDISFDRSINPYRGCEHGCVYCFARPTHAYLGLSPGLDFETRLFAKQDIAETLRRELSRPRYRCAVIALGVNTDAYQPVERRLRRTRAVLEVLSAFNHPVGLITKSHAVLRDLDLLAPMAAANLASVAVSLTTLDPELARRMEPRAPSPANRLRAIRALAEAGVPVTVMAAPMIPSVNDIELERILEAARDHGATSAGYVLLRVPLEIEGLVAEWLEAHRPGQARRVFALLRQAHQGKAYRSEFGTRMRGSGPYADMLGRRFTLATRKLGLNRRQWALDTTQFRVPDAGADRRQLSLF
ncbi:MAG: PA0069 family radical SAM protein [Alphaproteobacteria bacterium]